MEELKASLWDCDGSKSPSPDGFNFEFYRKVQGLICHDLLALVTDFFTTAKLPKGLNLAIVTLLPKTKFPTQFSDYRPISLTHGLYKVVAKILSNRLKHVIRDLISDSQTFFITGCRIVDVLMIANEMVQICRALVCLQQKLQKWLNGNWVGNVIWRRTLRTFEVEQAMFLHQVLQEVRLDHTKPVEGMDSLQRWEIYCEILEYFN